MLRTRTAITAFCLAGALLGARASTAQRPQPPGATLNVTIKVVSPDEGAYISGPMTLRALIDPPNRSDLVERVSLFADGKLICQPEAPPYECFWDAGENIEEHVVRAVASLRSGRRAAHTVRTRGLGYAERVIVDVVQVTATVSDGAGRYIPGLARDAFKVFEDDVPQSITHFTADEAPLEVVAIIDVSGSMADAMPELKAAVKRFLAALREKDRVTLLGFNDTVFTLARRETSVTARQRAVDRLTAWGGTALYDAIIRGIAMLGRDHGRRAMVIFTDGEDQSSQKTIEAVVEAVESSDAALYFVGLGRGATVETLRRLQTRLAAVSGGRAFFSRHAGELDAAFQMVVTDLSHQYLLAYPPVKVQRDNAWRRIRVEVADPNYRVRARQGYRAAPVRGGSE
jgi:Ca-activated chloride channel family protein